MQATKQGCKAAGRWAWRNFRLVAGIALVVGLALALASQREAIAAVDWSIEPLALAGAVALLAVAPLLQALTLGIALRRLGAGAPPVGTLRVWARSFLLRYEPSGVVGFAYRVRERDRIGATTPAGADRRRLRAARGRRRGRDRRGRRLRRSPASTRRSPRSSCSRHRLGDARAAPRMARRPARPLGRSPRGRGRRSAAPAHAGADGRDRPRGLGDDRGRRRAARHGLLGAAAPGGFLLLGAFALSWIAGVLLPLLPAGLGPRDAVLVVGLAGVTGAGPAAALAIALRVVSLAGELLAVAIAEVAALALARRDRATVARVARDSGSSAYTAPPARESAHDRRRPDLRRARGAAAVRRALRADAASSC